MGDGGIVVGQAKSNDMASVAVNKNPRAALPDPVLAVVSGEGVIDAQGATHGEAAIGDVVLLAGGPVLQFAVYN